MNYKIRPFTYADADYAAAVAIHSAAYVGDDYAPSEWKHDDDVRDAKHFHHRYAVEHDGEMIAAGVYCEAWWSQTKGEHALEITVSPDHQGKGVEQLCYDHTLAQLTARNPQLLRVDTREDQAAYMTFLEALGFEIKQREQLSELDVQAFDPTPFAGLAAKMQEKQVKILNYAELAALDDNWERKLYDLSWDILQDIPSTSERVRAPFEQWKTSNLSGPNYAPEAGFVALAPDGIYAGVSTLAIAPAAPEKLYTAVTGVRRANRRQGIATALKLRAIAYAKANGVEIIETGNEENNPMLEINVKLGFKPIPAWVTMLKKLEKK